MNSAFKLCFIMYLYFCPPSIQTLCQMFDGGMGNTQHLPSVQTTLIHASSF